MHCLNFYSVFLLKVMNDWSSAVNYNTVESNWAFYHCKFAIRLDAFTENSFLNADSSLGLPYKQIVDERIFKNIKPVFYLFWVVLQSNY